MAENDMRVPVYLITGFLESGKTSFLDYTVRQDYFQIDEPTLLINTEEGEEEYDPKAMLKYGVLYADVTEQEEFTEKKLAELDRKYHPGRVVIEYNPLWSVKAFEDMKLPKGWWLMQEIVTVDASTFQIYQNNMKSLFVEMSRNADMVLFNRCTDDLPLANFRRSIKVVNPGCEIMFEDMDREVIDIFEDSVPYDLNAPVIDVEDMDYGIFYVDLRDNPKRYLGKKAHFRGRILKSKQENAPYFVPGRMAMTCCADDTQFIGYVCEYKDSPSLPMGEWVEVTAEIQWKYMKVYKGKGPVFRALSVKPTTAPGQDLVYFS